MQLVFYEALTSAGVKPELARSVERQVEQELDRAFEQMRASLKEQSFTRADGAELKVEIAHLRKDLADSMRIQTNWLTGVAFAAAGAVIAAYKFL